jgi:CPA2 family monovalent cation:H+ antiporter-2
VPDTSFLVDVLQLLVAAIICVPLFQRLGLGSVLGYLVAGILVGPSGFALIAGPDVLKSLAELGVVFLLFTIGLELTFGKLSGFGARKFVLGLGQVCVTGLLAGTITYMLGHGLAAAAIMGGALAMSSTAIVVPLLASQSRLSTEFGQAAFAILLVQDIAMAPFLVLIETLHGNAAETGLDLAQALALASLKAVAAVAVIVAVGRFVLQPVFHTVAEARSPELSIGLALLVALGTSFITEHAGLSLAFGAFLAGLLLAETEFRHQVAADIEPFRGLLLGLFFITVGMSIDIATAAAHTGAVFTVTIALLAGKSIVIAVLARLLGHGTWDALRLGLLLSQGGEFAFVLIGLAAAAQLVPGDFAQIVLAAVGATLIAMPAIARIEERLGRWLDLRVVRLDGAEARIDLTSHVIVVGQGEVGRIVTRLLKAWGIPYLSLDRATSVVKALRRAGEPIYFGDGHDTHILNGLRADQARAIIVAASTPGTAEGVAAVCRHSFPHVPLIVRGPTEQSVLDLRKLGVTAAVQESTEIGLRLVAALQDDSQDNPFGDRPTPLK